MTEFDDAALLSIRREIISFAKEEDRLLSTRFGKGIFFMPEVAFVYSVGKNIASKADEIFPSQKVEWLREMQVGQGGHCDLILDVGKGGRIVFEFKMRDTLQSYKQDVEKLKFQVGDGPTRIFCALSNVYEKDLPADTRIQLLEKEFGSSIRRIGDLHSFPTWDVYTKPVHCVIGLWVVS